ncbi:MAG: BREX protein BrxB domain-containing protein [Snowella sp.]|nr:BREX protein BrxB domain-containing protein [Snowella sp.]
MGKIKSLVRSYGKHIAVPWRTDTAAAQRVIFCVYNEMDELRLRAKIDEFELATKEAGHEWLVFDMTSTFTDWFVSQKYAKSYFQKPALLSTLLPRYLDFINDQFSIFIQSFQSTDNCVVALQGIGSLFGFVKVKDVVDRLSPQVSGRLLVFFPGSYENNNYRLLDGYDGWNYLAIPITADQAL